MNSFNIFLAIIVGLWVLKWAIAIGYFLTLAEYQRAMLEFKFSAIDTLGVLSAVALIARSVT